MSREYLRDIHGHVYGTLEEDVYGRTVARDEHGRKLGEYDPKYNTTRDEHGRMIGDGDQTAYLCNNSR